MGKIVGISGGDLQSTKLLNELAITMTRKENPNVLFIPTASKDAEEYIEIIQTYYQTYGCHVQILELCHGNTTEEQIHQCFEKADLIYVGGGDTKLMLDIWKKYGVDQQIIGAYEKGTVITGISAGLIFWFRYGHSDSEYFKNPEKWNYIFVEGLNIFPFACCPHYNEEGRDSFDTMLKGQHCKGLALENNVAFIVEDEKFYIKKAQKEARAFLIEYSNGKFVKQELSDGEKIRFEP